MAGLFIDNIDGTKNCGVLTDWPKSQVVFGRYNLVYGWNGCGKTTLSRIVRSLEKEKTDAALLEEEAAPFLQFNLVDGSSITNKKLDGWKNNVRVFNCDFVKENIHADNAEAQPVYHLGEKQGDALKELAEVEAALEEVSQALKVLQVQKESEEKILKSNLTDNARVVREAINQSNFNATKLEAVLATLIKESNGSIFALEESDLLGLKATALGNNDKTKVDEIKITTPVDYNSHYTDVSKQCALSVTKTAIQELDNSFELREWVKQGYSLHQDRKTCAFCNAKLDEKRQELLAGYFNTAYNSLISAVGSALDNNDAILAVFEKMQYHDESRLYAELRSAYNSKITALKVALNELSAVYQSLSHALNKKKSNPLEIVSLVALKDLKSKHDKVSVALEEVNEVISSHNKQYDNFECKVREARAKISNHYAAQYLKSYSDSLLLIEDMEKQLEPMNQKLAELTARKLGLDAQLQEHDIAVGKINTLLASFLGRGDIQLVTQEKGYCIEREGKKAKFLSEGERTAIAFTYFIAKMEEKDFNLSESVVFIDDPISSLDTNALYAAGSFIRCHLEDAKQVFISTHNYQFFREIFGWIDPLKGNAPEGKPYKTFIMLQCDVDTLTGKRVAKPYKLDNTLRKYDSEYLFLFKQLCDARVSLTYKEDATADEIARLILLPNIARRVLETFVLFKFPNVATGSVINLFNAIKKLEVEVEPERVSILDRLLNRGSHGGETGMAEMNVFNLSETPKVIQYVLDFIREADALHFAGAIQAIEIKPAKIAQINSSPTPSEEAA